MNLPIVLREEKRKPAAPRTQIVYAPVMLPGTALLQLPPLPSDWQDAKRQVHLKLEEGGRTLWQDVHLPVSTNLVRSGRRYNLSATQNGDKVQLSVAQ